MRGNPFNSKNYNHSQQLLDGDGWPPVLVLVQETEADSARWVDVGMEEWGDELDLGWGGGKVLLEDHVALVETALPRSRLLTGDGELPL